MTIIPEFFPPSPTGQTAAPEPYVAEPFLEPDCLKRDGGEAPETPSASVADDADVVAAIRVALATSAPKVVVLDETAPVEEAPVAVEGNSKWGCIIA